MRSGACAIFGLGITKFIMFRTSKSKPSSEETMVREPPITYELPMPYGRGQAAHAERQGACTATVGQKSA